MYFWVRIRPLSCPNVAEWFPLLPKWTERKQIKKKNKNEKIRCHSGYESRKIWISFLFKISCRRQRRENCENIIIAFFSARLMIETRIQTLRWKEPELELSRTIEYLLIANYVKSIDIRFICDKLHLLLTPSPPLCPPLTMSYYCVLIGLYTISNFIHNE